jgi:hypothetical protein
MPYPLDDEGRAVFIRRCMRDDEARETFPDDDQRAAFCYAQWEDGQGYGGDRKKRKRRSRKMALEPKAEEQHGAFLTRCMADDEMNEEYESDGEREEACELIWSETEAPDAGGEGEADPEEYSAKAQAEDDDPEAPPKGEGEARDKWIADCLVNPDVVADIPDDEKRLAHCEEQWAAEYGDGEDDLKEGQASDPEDRPAIRILTGEQALAAAADAERLPTGYLQHWSDETVVQSTQPTKMSADFIVLTRQREPNRHGNIVQIADGENGRGLMLDHYRTNPVVLFDHGLNMTLPIGTSESSDGKLNVRLTKNRATARAYFSQSLPEAATIYALIDEGILRTASVQFLPKRARKLSIKQRQDLGDDEVSLVDGAGLDYTESDLLEWSVVSIPADPGAVRRCLDRGHVNGEAITMSLLPVMKEMGGPVPVWSPGWSPQSQHVISVDEDETSVTVKYERHEPGESQTVSDVDTEPAIKTIDYEAVATQLEVERRQRQKVEGATEAVAEALKPVTEAMDKLEDKLARLTG